MTQKGCSKMRDDVCSLSKIFADAGYQGAKMAKTVAATGRWKIEIVKRVCFSVQFCSPNPSYLRGLFFRAGEHGVES